MIESIKLRVMQGDPIVHDVHNASMPSLYRGLPELHPERCADGCSECAGVCPTNALTLHPMTIDLGKCIFCPLCEHQCLQKVIHFSDNYHMACSSREQLIVDGSKKILTPEIASDQIKKYFGRSLKLREISAGGCNGCELELNALSNVNFDMGRFGIEFVASPRHADGIVITGPLTAAMAEAASICYDAVPHPKIVVAVGACAISGGIFAESEQINRSFFNSFKVDLFIPGCPPHPLTFLSGILTWLGRKK